MSKKIRFTILTLVGLLVLVSAGSVAAESHSPLEDPIPEPIEEGDIRITLEPVATDMTAPNGGTSVPGCETLSDRLVITDQNGILWAVNLSTGEKSVLLDVSDRLVSLGKTQVGSIPNPFRIGKFAHHGDAHVGYAVERPGAIIANL